MNDKLKNDQRKSSGDLRGRPVFRSVGLDRFSPHYFVSLGDRLQRLCREGRSVIRLDIGSPDMPPPPFVIAALAGAAARPENHGYQSHFALPELRAAWADAYGRRHGVALDPDTEVVPLLGSKEGIFHLSAAVLNPGDVALVPDPGYATYAAGTIAAGAEPFYYRLDPGRNYLPDWKSIPPGILKRAKTLWLNYPHNPTGAVASPEFFAEAAAFAGDNHLLLIHDAAYSQIVFDGYRAPSVLESPGAKEIAVEFNSLSKSHNMAGWRVGVAVGNRDVLAALKTLKTQADSGHFRPILEAAAAALNGDQSFIPGRNEIYRRRRDLVVDGLKALGFAPARPKASLYVWSPIPADCSSVDWAIRLLERTGVSVGPGSAFGRGGEGFIRISLTAKDEEIRDALRRMETFLAE
ncbi:MAG: aminotransferase class I/II-fold pyridoxal phosphate-dependent enzyme [Candidatus Aminicenantales bacterium]